MTIVDLPGLSTANQWLLMYVFTYEIADWKAKAIVKLTSNLKPA